jgi:hypothetical protein
VGGETNAINKSIITSLYKVDAVFNVNVVCRQTYRQTDIQTAQNQKIWNENL